MIDINKRYVTRTGEAVQLLSTAGRGDYPVVGYMGASSNLKCWTIDGRSPSRFFDLIEAPPERWVNLYQCVCFQSRMLIDGGVIFGNRSEAEGVGKRPLDGALIYHSTVKLID